MRAAAKVTAAWLLACLVLLPGFALTGLAGEPDPARRVPPLRFNVPSPKWSPDLFDMANILRRQWEELGLEVKVEGFPMFTQWIARTGAAPHNWEAAMSTFLPREDRIDPDALLYSLFHSTYTRPGGRNVAGYQSERYDRVIEAQQRETDLKKRQALVHQAQEILAQELPAVTLPLGQVGTYYNHTRWKDLIDMPGRGQFNMWSLVNAKALTRDRTLRVGHRVSFASLNPLTTLAPLDAQDMMRFWFDTLVRVGPDLEPKPWAAESWTMDNPTTITVKLRPGMKWHDGKPVTARDVKFTYEAFRDWKIVLYSAYLRPIKSVEAVDDLTVRFHLNSPYPAIFVTSFQTINLLPQHIWAGITERHKVKHPGDIADAPEIFIGSAPLKLVRWRRNEDLILEKFDDHWAWKANPGPTLQRVVNIFYETMEARHTALKTGAADVHWGSWPTTTHVEDARTVRHLTVSMAPNYGAAVVFFNLRRAPMNDLALRRALGSTVDQDTMLKAILGGKGTKAFSPMSPALKTWSNPKVTRQFDMAKARQILKEAGYEWDSQGKLYSPARR
ncbi:MAG: hypothetical protein HYY85_21335 [Deltaproteobacteria bacterium]|nr:hypothetical protein [Deltaproteobacteria bacterium]